jgi:hypothetical protein
VAAASYGTAASAQGLDSPVVCRSQRNERNFMMNQTNGWMGGGMAIYTVIRELPAVPLIIMIITLSNKKS